MPIGNFVINAYIIQIIQFIFNLGVKSRFFPEYPFYNYRAR